MTKEQIESIESVTLGIAVSGISMVFPPSAPIVALLKWALHSAGEKFFPGTAYELSAEQAAAIAAGMAAAKASAVTSFKESHKDKLPSDVK